MHSEPQLRGEFLCLRMFKIEWMAESDSGSFGDSENQGSLQGDGCVASLDTLSENGCLNSCEVFHNSLTEELEVLNLTSNLI